MNCLRWANAWIKRLYGGIIIWKRYDPKAESWQLIFINRTLSRFTQTQKSRLIVINFCTTISSFLCGSIKFNSQYLLSCLILKAFLICPPHCVNKFKFSPTHTALLSFCWNCQIWICIKIKILSRIGQDVKIFLSFLFRYHHAT